MVRNWGFDDAKERVRELGEIWPGEYVVDNEETGSGYSLVQEMRRRTNNKAAKKKAFLASNLPATRS